MNLTIIGHEDRYAVEQLLQSLFAGRELTVTSRLTRGKTWLTATTNIQIDGKKSRAVRRLKAADETVRLRRQTLQQSVYVAALPHLERDPAWGALAGVRPTKISTRHLLEGGNLKSVDQLLKDVYFVTPERRRLALDCSQSTVNAVKNTNENDLSLYVGIPFCPTRCAYCSFVSRTVGKKTALLEPYLQALQQEIEQLIKDKNRLYNEYREAEKQATELSAIRHNVNQLTNDKPARKEQTQER